MRRRGPSLGGLLFVSLVCAACGGSDAETPAPTTGTVKLRFGVTAGAKKNPNLVDPLVGTVYGALYRAEDVTLGGPIDGAQDVASVELADVDVTVDTESSAQWTGEKVPAGSLVFLGFFDLDGNGAQTKDPDVGDPVTLPVTNTLDLEAGKTLETVALFDLIYN